MIDKESPSIKQDYHSPRWSGEICDCSMPLAMDTYNKCSYNCLYCFALSPQVRHHLRNTGLPTEKDVSSVNPKRVKKLFLNCLNDEPKTIAEKQMYPYIKNRVTMQWNGLADGFDEYERKYGVTLELLEFFDEIDYPLSLGTKATWWTTDDRYMDIMQRHTDDWHMKFSINTLDEYKASIIEEGCPTPKERLEALGRIANLGMPVTLRLRPYIIGYSDDYPKLIHEASKKGADSVVTEFLCIDSNATKEVKKRYDRISKVVGYDICKFYKKHSKGGTYLRLNYQIKKPVIKNMKKVAHKNRMRFYVSDADHKEKCDLTCCCGTPPHMKTYNGHYAYALTLAKQNKKDHTVRWKDFSKEAEKYMGFPWRRAAGFNTGRGINRIKKHNYTMSDYLQDIWNHPKNSKSPFKYFDGILYPVGLDEDNNVVYKLNIKKMKS